METPDLTTAQKTVIAKALLTGAALIGIPASPATQVIVGAMVTLLGLGVLWLDKELRTSEARTELALRQQKAPVVSGSAPA